MSAAGADGNHVSPTVQRTGVQPAEATETFSKAMHAFLQPTVNVSETIRSVVAQQQALNQEIEHLNQKMGYATGIASPQQQKQLELYVQKLRQSKQRVDALGKLLIGVKGRLWKVHTALQTRTRAVESDNALLVVQLESKAAADVAPNKTEEDSSVAPPAQGEDSVKGPEEGGAEQKMDHEVPDVPRSNVRDIEIVDAMEQPTSAADGEASAEPRAVVEEDNSCTRSASSPEVVVNREAAEEPRIATPPAETTPADARIADSSLIPPSEVEPSADELVSTAAPADAAEEPCEDVSTAAPADAAEEPCEDVSTSAAADAAEERLADEDASTSAAAEAAEELVQESTPKPKPKAGKKGGNKKR